MNSQSVHRLSQVAVSRKGLMARRDFLCGVTALAAGASPFARATLAADMLKREGRACILLWMQGGPSQFETFDPKPGVDAGGETKAIATRISGVQFSENLPSLAEQAHRLAVIRSVTTKEGNHQRASFLLHTSRVPTASVQYPTLGSIVANETPLDGMELPSFVRIGGRLPNAGGGGFLGAAYDPFSVADASRMPQNTQPFTAPDRYRRRLRLLARLEEGNAELADGLADDHRALYDRASRMIQSEQMQAFDISRETVKSRQVYGQGDLSARCLLARRLVEAGVPFVEVVHGNWDTHDDNFNRSRALCQELDQPFAGLLRDLADRGLLERTLVVWMGEFGRTPRINPRAGRDHFPRAFSVALAGGGVRGGRVVGKTQADGGEVQDRPVTTADLFRTVYRALGIDADKENMSPIGRPIRLVDGGKSVNEVFA